MAYRNIRDIVSQSFEQTRDLRIEHTIEQNGASHLLSAVYNSQDAEDRKFYRKPKLAEGEETKLAILYGETMITPYIIDVGVGNGVNDPSNITRTIRFIAGDGETEGVVVGPNGSLLENVYLGSEGEQAQPVIDDDGRPSTKDILLGAALGGLVQAAPSIWDAIFDDAPDADKLGEIDPITGGKILTKEEKRIKAELTANMKTYDLNDFSEVVMGEGYVPVWDNAIQQYVPKHINDIIRDAETIQSVGGTVGTPGTPGTPAIPGTPEIPASPGTPEIPEVPAYDIIVPGTIAVLPSPSSCNATGTKGTQDSYEWENIPRNAIATGAVADTIELIDFTQLWDNEYLEVRNLLGTDGIELHFLYDALYLHKELVVVPGTPPVPGTECCFPADGLGADTPIPETPDVTLPVDSLRSASVEVDICISIWVCGNEYVIYNTPFIVTGLSDTEFTRHVKILWEDTPMASYIAAGIADEVINENYTIRLRRSGGTGQHPVHYQGIKRIEGTSSDNESVAVFTPAVNELPPIPLLTYMDDDLVYPQSPPLSSGLGPVTCPEGYTVTIPAVPAVPATGPTDLIPAVPGTPAVDPIPGTYGEYPDIVAGPAPAIPKIIINKPFSTLYTEDTLAGPYFHSESDLAVIQLVDSGLPSVVVTCKWEIILGEGHLLINGALPAGVSIVITDDTHLSLIGNAEDMPAASLVVKIQAADEAKGEIQYSIKVENAENASAGMVLKVLPTSTEIKESKSACTEITLTGDLTDEGTTSIFTTVPSATSSEDTEDKELTSSAVTKLPTETISDHAFNVAQNMQLNINNKNALDKTDKEWLALYVVTVTGPKINICAPAAGGESFNGYELSAKQTGDLGVDWLDSILGWFGGATRSIFNTPSNEPDSVWSEIGDVLLGIGGNIAGMAVANMLFNDSSTLSISIPEEDKDVTVAFLYRGRKVKMPTAYDPATRTGTPTFSGWGGDWTNSTLTKTAWTDNPAWCLLDYIENRKFGLGDDIVLSVEQKDQLVSDIFEIAAYCDQVVDGEARFSLNTAITDGTKIQILEQLCSVFFGSFVFYKGGLRIRADKPDTDIKLLVNQANAGEFTYEHATLKSFINKVVVTYVDPNSFYIEKTVTVENQQGIDKYGEKAAQVFGFGITSETQALRYANWVLQSEIENSLTVSYKGGWDHYRLIPGDIVQFEDSNERGQRLAGRVVSNFGSAVTFDSDTVASVGDSISLLKVDGTVHESTITQVNSSTQVVMADVVLGSNAVGSTFIVADQSIGKQLFRVVKVDETSDGVFNTTLQLYNADKYNKIIAATRS